MPDTQSITRYYDTTTAWFLRFGETRTTGAIHRAVRLPEFSDIDATDTVHHLIARAIKRMHPAASVAADLGCGVGASMARMRVLVPQLEAIYGITISPVQARFARQRGQDVYVASYHDLPFADASLDVVWAIESLVHSATPERFYAEVARCLRPGGVLCVVDDTATDIAMHSTWVPYFVNGWQAHGLQSVDAHVASATQVGMHLCELTDMTAGLTLRTLPPWFAARVGALATWRIVHPMVPSMVGSMALQHALAESAIAYVGMVFQRYA